MTKATGQITIIDYNDALTLSGFIGSNLVKTQMSNPDNGSFSPSWAESPYLVLTPSLYKIGSTSDIITDAAVTSVKWYEYVDGKETQITATTDRVFSGTKNHILTIKKNEVLPTATTWMDVEGTVLNEISQVDKDKYNMISL